MEGEGDSKRLRWYPQRRGKLIYTGEAISIFHVQLPEKEPEIMQQVALDKMHLEK